MDLTAAQREQMVAIIDAVLTGTFYTLLPGLDGSANIGGVQQIYKIYGDDGNLISDCGDIEAEAAEAFSQAVDAIILIRVHSLVLLLPLLMQAAPSKLVVQWSTPHELREVVQAAHTCDASKPVEQRFEIALVRCDGEACQTIETRTASLDERSGTVSFENVPPGPYRLSTKVGGLLNEKVVDVRSGPPQEAHLDLRWYTISGHVRRNGKPVHARVFRSAVTDPETGRYVAALAEAPRGGSYLAEPCDGSGIYRFVMNEPPAENSAFDIEIPSNRLDIEVVDAASGQPVKEAIVTYAAPRDETGNAVHFTMGGLRTDERGRLRLGPLAPDQTLMVCARHDDYENVCADRFRLRVDEQKSLRIALTKLQRFTGRVIAPATGLAMVTWHGPGGVTESVRTDREGRFVYRKPHAAGEIVTISSETFFYAFVQGASFDFHVPAVRARTFEVHLAPNAAAESGAFTIAIGDLVVPAEGLTQHMMREGQQPVIERGASRVVRNVLETAPLSVVYEGRTRRPLGQQSMVIFD